MGGQGETNKGVRGVRCDVEGIEKADVKRVEVELEELLVVSVSEATAQFGRI